MFMSDKPLLSWVALLMPGNHLACGDELVVNDRTLLFVSLLPFLKFLYSTTSSYKAWGWNGGDLYNSAVDSLPPEEVEQDLALAYCQGNQKSNACVARCLIMINDQGCQGRETRAKQLSLCSSRQDNNFGFSLLCFVFVFSSCRVTIKVWHTT